MNVNNMNVKINYIIDQANLFNMGAAWGMSIYGNLLFETACRVWEQVNEQEYPHKENRMFRLLTIGRLVEMAEKENEMYKNSSHTKTYNVMKEMIEILKKNQ